MQEELLCWGGRLPDLLSPQIFRPPHEGIGPGRHPMRHWGESLPSGGPSGGKCKNPTSARGMLPSARAVRSTVPALARAMSSQAMPPPTPTSGCGPKCTYATYDPLALVYDIEHPEHAAPFVDKFYRLDKDADTASFLEVRARRSGAALLRTASPLMHGHPPHRAELRRGRGNNIPRVHSNAPLSLQHGHQRDSEACDDVLPSAAAPAACSPASPPWQAPKCLYSPKLRC